METADFNEKLEELHHLLITIKGRQISSVSELDERRYYFRYVAGCMPLMCYAEINPVSNIFLVRAMLSSPGKKVHSALIPYIMKVNHSLPIGSYTMDEEDGEVRFKIGYCFGYEPLSAHLMLTHIDATCYFLDHHIEEIVHIMMNDLPDAGGVKPPASPFL
ncbi:hypothetical protein IAD21_03541 [Abditibacteriota bacterium]|nr:hypothetical protein IAD21_03541 [Abditibacteriota bacterium]